MFTDLLQFELAVRCRRRQLHVLRWVYAAWLLVVFLHYFLPRLQPPREGAGGMGAISLLAAIWFRTTRAVLLLVYGLALVLFWGAPTVDGALAGFAGNPQAAWPLRWAGTLVHTLLAWMHPTYLVETAGQRTSPG